MKKFNPVQGFSHPDATSASWPECLGAWLYQLPQGMQDVIQGAEMVLAQLRVKLEIGQQEDRENPPASRPAKAPSGPRKKGDLSDSREKLVAALTKHHRYAEGGCLELEPIGVNALARLAGTSRATACRFFAQQFRGHKGYRTACRDPGTLGAALRLLNRDFPPHILLRGSP
jgi:hypothetical protein